MRVQMMTVVVAMHVVVLDWLVGVTMSMPLACVKVDAEAEQRSRRDRERTGVPVAKCPCESGSNERRQREHGARATRPDAALREQVQIQARAVTSRAARDEDRRV